MGSYSAAHAMNKVFGSLFLPIVSSRDTLFLKRVFERSHVDYILKNTDLLCTTHLSLGQTLQVARRGILCVDSSGLRRTFKKFVQNCPTCLKMNFDSPDGRFTHITTNPRLLTVFGQETVCFHTVSCDLTPRFIIKNFHGSRGRRPTYKIYGLFITDLVTGTTSVELMDHATSTHVVAAIASFANKFRKPALVICDAGPQLKTLEHNPIWEGLRRSGIEVRGVAPRHQFLNFAERAYQEWKSVMEGMRQDVNRTIYSQDDTIIELMHKLNLAANILNSAPILASMRIRTRDWYSGTRFSSHICQGKV